MRNRLAVMGAGLCLSGVVTAQQTISSADELFADISTVRGEIVINVLGDLWRVPESGGVATRLVESDSPATRPRWSPDSRRLVYQSGTADESAVRVVDLDSGNVRTIGRTGDRNRHPDWHPSGDRIIYASMRDGGSFDLWETDLASGLDWRLTGTSGDDLEPAWSDDGRDLAWVRQSGDRWQLLLRPFGQPERLLAESDTPLGAPSFRPDGTLVTYFRESGGQYELRMVILSEPPLDRMLADDRGLFPARIAWKDRSTFYYTAADQLRQREFDDWTGRPVPFRAALPVTPVKPSFQVAARDLPMVSPAGDRLVMRAGRLWDGYSRSYRADADVLVEDGLIADITERRDWGDVPVIDLQSMTMLPGYIDLHARLPEGDPRSSGAGLLAWGVTTIVAEPGEVDARLWEGEAFPGPRLLPAAALAVTTPDGVVPDLTDAPFLVVAHSLSATASERVASLQASGIPVLADDWLSATQLDTYLLPAATPVAMLIGGSDRPGYRHQAFNLARRALVSQLADRRTPGLDSLFDARQAAGLRRALPLRRRAPLLDDLRRSRSPIALASAGNRLPPGLATHAEFLALSAAGLANDQVLRAAGRYAATLLGLPGRIGEISVGARADLVLVTGDPLSHIEDAWKIAAVMRNGRFHSLVSLIERRTASVEEFDDNQIEDPVAE